MYIEDIDIVEQMLKTTRINKRGKREIKFEVNSNYFKAIENLIKGYKELEEYQHKVNQILNLDDDNLDIVLVDNCQKGLKKCVTEFERENQSYRDYFGTPPCYDNANYIPKSKVQEKIDKLGIYREKHYYFRKDLSKAQHDNSMKMLGGIEYLQELLEEKE